MKEKNSVIHSKLYITFKFCDAMNIFIVEEIYHNDILLMIFDF